MYCKRSFFGTLPKKGHPLKAAFRFTTSKLCLQYCAVCHLLRNSSLDILMIDWALAYWIDIFFLTLPELMSIAERHCVDDFKTPIPPSPPPPPPPLY